MHAVGSVTYTLARHEILAMYVAGIYARLPLNWLVVHHKHAANLDWTAVRLALGVVPHFLGDPMR